MQDIALEIIDTCFVHFIVAVYNIMGFIIDRYDL